MGLDVGDKRIGVALSDLLGWTAQAYDTIYRSNYEKDMKKIQAIVEQKQVGKIVVGLPKNMNGSLGPQGKKVIKFADQLKKYIGIEILFWDERLTTISAERILIDADISRSKRKTVIDKIAATYILQGYLDSIN